MRAGVREARERHFFFCSRDRQRRGNRRPTAKPSTAGSEAGNPRTPSAEARRAGEERGGGRTPAAAAAAAAGIGEVGRSVGRSAGTSEAAR